MTSKQKILAVDDEPKNLRILAVALDEEWEMRTAASGEEALAMVESFAPDLVLLDIMMPGIDGYEVCRRIRANPKLDGLKVILVSGKAMVEERLKGYDCGADDYLTKPFVPEELQAKVKVFMRLTLTERTLKNLTDNLEATVSSQTKQLVEAKARMVTSARLSALGEMARGIAHEINTPLATIGLTAEQVIELTKESPPNISEIVEMTNLIVDTVHRIDAIITGLRTFSRDGSKDPTKLVLASKLIEGVLDLCRTKFVNNGVNITATPLPENLFIQCRPVELSQVLLNLLNNAYDAVRGLGEKWIKMHVEPSGDDLIISITDSGNGIPIDVAEKLFQPFFTTKEIGKGTGLGLSISKGIIEGHKGTLTLDTACPNTRFLVRIPGAEGAIAAEASRRVG